MVPGSIKRVNHALGESQSHSPSGPDANAAARSTTIETADPLWWRLVSQLWYYTPSILTLVGLLLFWQFAVEYWQIKQFILPSPLDALAALGEERFHWGHNLYITLSAVVGAFFFTAVTGLLLGTALVWSSMLERTLLPLLVIFNTLPKIALAPMVIFWIGYGVKANIVIGVAVAFFPMALNSAAGLRNVDPDLLNLLQALKAKKWQIFLKIRLPSALPYIFVGLKLAAVFATVGAIVGEFIASTAGLGAVIIVGNTTLDTPSIFASLLLISAIGMAFYGLVIIAERLFVPWEFREQAFI
jgi:NitT/TauT family transport system permease protein